MKINIPFGTKLTDLATLPANAKRSLEDPYEDKAAARRRRQFVLLGLLILIAAGWVRWDATQHRDPDNKRPRYFWEDRTAPAKPDGTKSAAPLPAPAANTTKPGN